MRNSGGEQVYGGDVDFSSRSGGQTMIVDPEYVDQLALEVVTLGMEIEQFRAALAEQARRDALQPTTDPVFKATCRQLAQYIETRAKKAENLSGIAIRYGTHCKQQGGRVLV